MLCSLAFLILQKLTVACPNPYVPNRSRINLMPCAVTIVFALVEMGKFGRASSEDTRGIHGSLAILLGCRPTEVPASRRHLQVAAAMIHYRDENLSGARGLISKAKEKFRKIDEFKVETELMETYLSWSTLKKMVNKVPKESSLEDFSELFEFRFIDPATWKVE